MICYRFCHRRYAEDLSGQGSRLFGGRWNSKGLPALYCSSSISLALLEILIHAVSFETLKNQMLVTLAVDEKEMKATKVSKLKENWQLDLAYSQYIGDSFLSLQKNLILQVPSAIVAEEFNFVFNPSHSSISHVKVEDIKPYGIDNRLFK